MMKMNELIVPTRRKFLLTLTGLIAAPAVVKFDSLMAIKSLPVKPMMQFSFSPEELAHATFTRDGMIKISNQIVTPEFLANYLQQDVSAMIVEKVIYSPTSFVADVEGTLASDSNWKAKKFIDWVDKEEDKVFVNIIPPEEQTHAHV